MDVHSIKLRNDKQNEKNHGETDGNFACGRECNDRLRSKTKHIALIEQQINNNGNEPILMDASKTNNGIIK